MNKLPLSTKRIQNELADLLKSPVPNCSAGPIDDSDLTKWIATIFGPEGTPYYGGVFNLGIEFTSEYPFKPPKVYFLIIIYIHGQWELVHFLKNILDIYILGLEKL